MAFATTGDGVRLFYEAVGQGSPIVFVHEFGGNHWSWEPQVGYFSRRHRCIVYSARGYPPSDIPQRVDQYSQARAADDIVDVMNAAGIERAHVVGLSMGAFACPLADASVTPQRGVYGRVRFTLRPDRYSGRTQRVSALPCELTDGSVATRARPPPGAYSSSPYSLILAYRRRR